MIEDDLATNAYWAAWRRLRDGKAEEDDLFTVLEVIVPLWRRAIDLAPRAAAYDAMRDAYQRTDGTSKEKQAAACRAGGLTRTDGSAGQRNRRQILDRWYELTREKPRDPRRALERLASEQGVTPATMARALRRYRSEIEKLIADGDPASEWLRAEFEALSEPPAAIPTAWE